MPPSDRPDEPRSRLRQPDLVEIAARDRAPATAPADRPETAEALLALNHDKSASGAGCPTPRVGCALEIVTTEGELKLVKIGCGRNTCPVCRRRNVHQTAAKMGLNQLLTDRPVTHAVLSTTRDWADAETLREGWHQFARRVRKEVCSDASYAWVREFTNRDATHDWKRTHYHSMWSLDSDEQAADVAAISIDVWGRLTGATSEKAHGWQPIWDAGGLTRYMAGLVGHHLKANQAPPPGWAGRRFGTSRGFYAIDSRELDRQAKDVARDDRLRYHLEHAMAENMPDELPYEIFDEVVTRRLEEARKLPPPRLVRFGYGLPEDWPW